MLTRLKVDGFKNLIDVDLSFGPFTCIAGANGVGKSNVFDAIAFLGNLADATFVEAAAAVRSDGDEGAELADVLFRSGDCSRDVLSFECELLIPRLGEDDLGQPAEATSTFLRYSLELCLRSDGALGSTRLELVREELVHINKSAARADHLPFVGKDGGEWFDSVFANDRKGGPFISTVVEQGERKVRLHQDGRSVSGEKRRGRTVDFLADRLPRTVLSSTSAVESPTATLVRRELRSWRRLQLEASSLRRSDRFDAPAVLGADGSHMPKTLHELAEHERAERAATNVYFELTARLTELVDDIRGIDVDVDQVRRRLTLNATSADGIVHPARSLSDGTLRFLALAILERGSRPELICLEEPENGIHPTRIAAIIQLLLDIVVDPDFPVDEDNPLRQVIVNTHSPGFVESCPIDSLVVADTVERLDDRSGCRIKAARFSALPRTWRHRRNPSIQPIFLPQLLSYLAYTPRSGTSVPADAVGSFVEDQLPLEID